MTLVNRVADAKQEAHPDQLQRQGIAATIGNPVRNRRNPHTVPPSTASRAHPALSVPSLLRFAGFSLSPYTAYMDGLVRPGQDVGDVPEAAADPPLKSEIRVPASKTRTR
jgi:hypothetical protein